MKKPEEIKKGLECCSSTANCADGCPYHVIVEGSFGCDEMGCEDGLLPDALAYIQQLENKLNQAVEDIRMLGRIGNWLCPVCAHYNHGEGTKGKCVKCFTGDGFRWRGEKEEEHAD